MVGMKVGEERDVNVKFPDEYHAPDLAGKDATFKVKLHEIKEKILPELDDEFAKDVSEFDTLEDYKKDLNKKVKMSDVVDYEFLKKKDLNNLDEDEQRSIIKELCLGYQFKDIYSICNKFLKKKDLMKEK